MRESLPEAAASGRDINDGLKKRSKAQRITELLAELLDDGQ
jgi:hypothetical protein